jgi:hypothetical protein
MECDQCGARRPRSGPCPNCGAPPPGTFSSMRQWRGQSRSGEGPAVGRGAGGRGSGANWQQGGWDEGGYEDQPAAHSSGRHRGRGQQDYDEVELDRAIVPVRDDMLPMDASGMGAGVPALPGMPQTDEEERALGIRRPVYIPATGERKRKLGTWRVTSGVLSVMLVCVASCALAGLLGRNTILAFLQGPVKSTATPVVVSTAGIPVTPVATPGAQATLVKNVVTAKGVDASGLPKTPTSSFTTGDHIYVVMRVEAFPAGTSHTISIRCFYQDLDIQLPNAATTLPRPGQTGAQQLYFIIPIPQPGQYHVKVYVDRLANDNSNDPNDPALAATIYFAVLMPTPVVPNGTRTPGTTTPGTGTPSGTATPTKTP